LSHLNRSYALFVVYIIHTLCSAMWRVSFLCLFIWLLMYYCFFTVQNKRWSLLSVSVFAVHLSPAAQQQEQHVSMTSNLLYRAETPLSLKTLPVVWHLRVGRWNVAALQLCKLRLAFIANCSHCLHVSLDSVPCRCTLLESDKQIEITVTEKGSVFPVPVPPFQPRQFSRQHCHRTRMQIVRAQVIHYLCKVSSLAF